MCKSSLKKACRRNGISRWPHRAYKIVNEKMAKANSATFDHQMLEEEIRKLNETKKSLFDDPSFASFRLKKPIESNLNPQTQPICNDSLCSPQNYLDKIPSFSEMTGSMTVHEIDFPNETEDSNSPMDTSQNHNDFSPSDNTTNPSHSTAKHVNFSCNFSIPHLNTIFSLDNECLRIPIPITPKLPDPRLIQILLQLTTRLTRQSVLDTAYLAGIQPFYKSKARSQNRTLPVNMDIINPRDYFTWDEVLPPFGKSLRHSGRVFPIPSINTLPVSQIQTDKGDLSGEGSNGEIEETHVLPTKRKRQKYKDKGRLSKSF
jgi:hypothetical protein